MSRGLFSQSTVPPSQNPSHVWSPTYASSGEFPSQVMVNHNNQFACPGSILSTLLILTTAKCLMNRKPLASLSITAGVHDGLANSHSELEFRQVRSIKQVFIHENFSEQSSDNDIAILLLRKPLQYTAQVQNISLPLEPIQGPSTALAISWSGNRLMKQSAGSIQNELCHQITGKGKPDMNGTICAAEQAWWPCENGGSLVCYLEGGNGSSSSTVLCGLGRSQGKCGFNGVPSFWTSIYSYLDWIESVRLKILTLGKCGTDYLYCYTSRKCVPRTELCSKVLQCSREETVTISGCNANCSEETHFRCNNGRCIPRNMVCNGVDDCGDMSEEHKCPGNNSRAMFQCSAGQHQCGQGGRCIPEEWKCDQNFDCDDSSDEIGCPQNGAVGGEVSVAEVPCYHYQSLETSTTGRSTTQAPFSDKMKHFSLSNSNQSDCPVDQRRCRAGPCVETQFFCDNEPDCPDGSDEENCQKQEKWLKQKREKEDRQKNLVNAMNWTTALAEESEFPSQVAIMYDGRFLCSGSIIRQTLVLTTATCLMSRSQLSSLTVTAGVIDQDPEFKQVQQATTVIFHDAFDNVTLDHNLAIIALKEPLLYSDRVRNITLPPKRLKCSYNNIALEFVKSNYDQRLQMVKVNTGLIPNKTLIRNCKSNGVNMTTTVCSEESGFYACESGGALICKLANGMGQPVLCGLGRSPGKCVGNGFPTTWTKVANYVAWIRSIPEIIKTELGFENSLSSSNFITMSEQKCRTDYFYCPASGSCLSRSNLCNKLPECFPSNSQLKCDQNETCPPESGFRCSNGNCVLRRFLCDGEDDCRDHSDEDKCPPPPTDPSKAYSYGSCSLGQYQCGLGGRCILEEWKCDGHLDCDDESDEESCPSGSKNYINPEIEDGATRSTCDSDEDIELRRIIGGRDADPSRFPFQVTINEAGSLVCGGAILSPILILTAAHCVVNKVDNLEPLRVTAGQLNRFGLKSATGQSLPVKKVYIHEGYDNVTSRNDIALLVLTEEFRYTKNIRNVALPSPGEEFKGCLTAVGWGSTIARISAKLKKVGLTIIPREECARSYRNTTVTITEEMMCAGDPGKDSCSGDSGGPGVCERMDGTQVVCGVVSFGVGCGNENYPGGYTRVAMFIDWIEEIANKEMDIFYHKCSTDQFYCHSNKTCLSRESLCDKMVECSDSDVGRHFGYYCSQLRTCNGDRYFRCDNANCIDKRRRCNGYDECGDNSDEFRCPNSTQTCVKGQHHDCGGGRCIPDEWRCDKEIDCDDGSDERNCSETTTVENGGAGNGSQVSNYPMGTMKREQAGAAVSSCAPGQWKCFDGQCIKDEFYCDNELDCDDGSDEKGCLKQGKWEQKKECSDQE